MTKRKKTALQPGKGPHYHNILLIAQDGKHLATIGERRANWYVKRNLGKEVQPPKGYPRAIQICFAHNKTTPVRSWEKACHENQCVICGKKTELTLHHVVPSVIRRFFPKKEKDNARNWCVLLCIEDHLKAEQALDLTYRHGLPKKPQTVRNHNLTLQTIKHNGAIDRVPAERLQELLAGSDYPDVASIPAPDRAERRALFKKYSEAHQEDIKIWALEFIATHGGVDGTKALFRKAFLKLNPKHLPKEYLT